MTSCTRNGGAAKWGGLRAHSRSTGAEIARFSLAVASGPSAHGGQLAGAAYRRIGLCSAKASFRLRGRLHGRVEGRHGNRECPSLCGSNTPGPFDWPARHGQGTTDGEDVIVITTRLRDTAFKRALQTMPLGMESHVRTAVMSIDRTRRANTR